MQDLVSKHFAQFFDNVSESIYSFPTMMQRISENLHLIADDIHLGRYSTTFTLPISKYEPEGLTNSTVSYTSEKGFSEEVFEKSFVTAEGGVVTTKLNPIKGYTWSEEEKISLNHLCLLSFMLCSRTRLMGLMYKVQRSDSLTGALNSTGFQEIAGSLIQDGVIGQYSTVFTNIKNFKIINQQVGGHNGDIVIQNFCNSTSEFLGENGFFSRLGGDNFLALVKTSILQKYLAFLQDINMTLQVRGKEFPLHVEVKTGICNLTPQSTMAEVMTNASLALNVAKKSAFKDTVTFSPEMFEQTMHDKRIASQFHDSLENQEFLVYYQPKVDLNTSKLCGCEALARWKRDKIIPPAEFIPILETEGSIRSLDFYISESVCKDLRNWLDRGIQPVLTSVNFSKIHLSNLKLEDEILSLVSRYQIPKHTLEIELTELSDYQYYDRLVAFVTCMHDNGIHISIDDFGTGYSSIKLIKNLQADVIKLDKSLIDNIKITATHNPDKIVSNAIIKMASELNISVIAEGVETTYQAQFLKQAGCAMAQGYLYNKPLTHDEYEQLLTGNRTYDTKRNK